MHCSQRPKLLVNIKVREFNGPTEMNRKFVCVFVCAMVRWDSSFASVKSDDSDILSADNVARMNILDTEEIECYCMCQWIYNVIYEAALSINLKM